LSQAEGLKDNQLPMPQSGAFPVPPLPHTASLPFQQTWRESPEAGFQTGLVRVGWSAGALEVGGEFEDAEVQTRATADNQRLWELGDVFEVFLQVEGRADYIELHVAPNAVRMHLRFPHVLSRDEPWPFQQLFVNPVGFHAKAGELPGGWWAGLEIPCALLGLKCLTAGLVLRAGFCRYDYGPSGEAICSSTAILSEMNFHQPEEWTRCVLEGGA
jgi:hypothetical protein